MTEPARKISLVEDRWANLRHIVETIAIVTAGFWAFYTFVYQERIKPASEPASLAVSISIHRLGADATREILSASSVYRNDGKTPINIAADGFDIYGIRYGKKTMHRKSVSDGEFSDVDDIPVQSQHVVDAFIELRSRALGGDPIRDISLEPDATETIDRTFVVARGAYDAVFAQVIAVPIKSFETRKMDLRVIHRPDGSYWIDILHGDGHEEDDNKTEFSLLPTSS